MILSTVESNIVKRISIFPDNLEKPKIASGFDPVRVPAKNDSFEAPISIRDQAGSS